MTQTATGPTRVTAVAADTRAADSGLTREWFQAIDALDAFDAARRALTGTVLAAVAAEILASIPAATTATLLVARDADAEWFFLDTVTTAGPEGTGTLDRSYDEQVWLTDDLLYELLIELARCGCVPTGAESYTLDLAAHTLTLAWGDHLDDADTITYA